MAESTKSLKEQVEKYGIKDGKRLVWVPAYSIEVDKKPFLNDETDNAEEKLLSIVCENTLGCYSGYCKFVLVTPKDVIYGLGDKEGKGKLTELKVGKKVEVKLGYYKGTRKDMTMTPERKLVFRGTITNVAVECNIMRDRESEKLGSNVITVEAMDDRYILQKCKRESISTESKGLEEDLKKILGVSDVAFKQKLGKKVDKQYASGGIYGDFLHYNKTLLEIIDLLMRANILVYGFDLDGDGNVSLVVKSLSDLDEAPKYTVRSNDEYIYSVSCSVDSSNQFESVTGKYTEIGEKKAKTTEIKCTINPDGAFKDMKLFYGECVKKAIDNTKSTEKDKGPSMEKVELLFTEELKYRAFEMFDGRFETRLYPDYKLFDVLEIDTEKGGGFNLKDLNGKFVITGITHKLIANGEMESNVCKSICTMRRVEPTKFNIKAEKKEDQGKKE